MTKLRVNESSEFWSTIKRAAYEVAFTSSPWKYSSPDAGRFWGMREFFRRLGPAMNAYAGACQVRPAQHRTALDDLLLEATAQRGALLEIE